MEYGAVYNKQKIWHMLHYATVPITERVCDISAERNEAWGKV